MAKPTLLTYAGKFLLHPTDPTKNLAKLFPYIDIIVNSNVHVAPPCNRGTIVQTDYEGYHYRWTCDDYTDLSEAFMNTVFPDPPGVSAQVIFRCYHFENVVNMDRMFMNCDWIDNLEQLHVGRYLQSATHMCYGCTHTEMGGGITVDANNKVLNDVSYMFYDCQEFDGAHVAYQKLAALNLSMNTYQCFYNVPYNEAEWIPESWGGLMHE